MRILYHHWLSAPSRTIRLALGEKCLTFESRIEKTWDQRADFLAMNPAGDVPVLIDEGGATLTEGMVIREYLEEIYPNVDLLGRDPIQRAETRRLIAWFEGKFAREVTDNLVGEKILKRLSRAGAPWSEAVRAGRENVHYHLEYVGYLAERRKWLAGDRLSYADLAAAAHLSCVDYLGDVPWDEHPAARDWYARIKSRPSFRPLLADHIPGVPPPKHYADLDF